MVTSYREAFVEGFRMMITGFLVDDWTLIFKFQGHPADQVYIILDPIHDGLIDPSAIQVRHPGFEQITLQQYESEVLFFTFSAEDIMIQLQSVGLSFERPGDPQEFYYVYEIINQQIPFWQRPRIDRFDLDGT